MLTVRLMGPPAVELDGRRLSAPRGRKAWALLSYVVLAERPVSRRRLAELLFAEADDPLGALRWTLAELRRTLHRPDALTGDPVATGFGDDVALDVDLVRRPTPDPGVLLGLGDQLLDGVELASNPEFDSWLLVERHRLSAMLEARLRQSAVALLASGRPDEAVRYASRTVELSPLEEGNHELLVRSLAAGGDRGRAQRQVRAAEDLLRRDLGVEASPALREAASVEGAASPTALPVSGRLAAVSQLEAGRAAIVAGAVDAGIECLRRAVSEAARAHDAALHARSLVALGSALVHSVRGRDEEGSVVLEQAVMVATDAGDPATAATAHRELGFIEVQAGRRATADERLATAEALAETDAELAAVLGVRGMNASDLGSYQRAMAHLQESVERAARAGDHRQQAWSLSILGRAHLLRDEPSQAEAALAESLTLVQEQRWMAFLPWPQALRAELDLDLGHAELAADGFERAWALACQVADPCWEGMAARGLGRVSADRGDHTAAGRWFGEAAARCVRVPDRYQWVHGYVLDALVTAALARGTDRDIERAKPLVDALWALASRCDLRELVVRAHLHRHHLGDPHALAAARLQAADIDNPALPPLLAGSVANGHGEVR